MMPVVLSLVWGIVLGLGSGGKFGRLEDVKLRFPYALISVFLLQGLARGRLGIAGTGQWSVLAWGASSLVLIVLLLLQRDSAALVLVAAGVSLNLLVVLLNGFMPVYGASGADPAALGAGLAAARDFYAVGNTETLARVLADGLPLPLAGSQYFLSAGDVLLVCGVSGFLVNATLTPSASAT